MTPSHRPAVANPTVDRTEDPTDRTDAPLPFSSSLDEHNGGAARRSADPSDGPVDVWVDDVDGEVDDILARELLPGGGLLREVTTHRGTTLPDEILRGDTGPRQTGGADR